MKARSHGEADWGNDIVGAQTGDSDFRQRLGQLKTRIADLEGQVRAVRRRIDRLADRGLLARRAVVDSSRCTGCGLCEELCPQDAVQVSHVAAIDAARCVGCGVCVQYCPQGAIRLSGEG